MNKSIKCIGILVSYYQEDRLTIVEEFRLLVKEIDPEAKVLIVNNNSANKNLNLPDVIEIQGSNCEWEFSGWEEGLIYAETTGLLYGVDSIVFANDTFQNHRIFTDWNKKAFISKFRSASKGEIVGDVNSAKCMFSLDSVYFERWLSTYLFLVNTQDLSKIRPLNRSQDFDITIMDKRIFIENADEHLNKHLSEWIFPRDKNGWYRASSDLTMKRNKLKAILNEKLLTVNASKNNIKIIGVYDSLFKKIVYAIQHRLYRVIKGN